MEFKNNEHRIFFIDSVNRWKKDNEVNSRFLSMIYVFGLSSNIIKYIDDVFDFESKSIKTESFNANWITTDDLNKIRLGFYFYCDWCYESDVDASIGFKSVNYSLNSFFSKGNNMFLHEAINIRYQVDDFILNSMIMNNNFEVCGQLHDGI